MDILETFENDPTKSEVSERDIEDSEILKAIENMKSIWMKPLQTKHAAYDAAERFGVLDQYLDGTLLPTGSQGLETLYERKLFALTRIEMQLYMRQLMDIRSGTVTEDIAGADLKHDLQYIHMSMTHLYRTLRTDLLTKRALDPSWASECPNIHDDLVAFDETKMSEYHSFVFYVLQKLCEAGYARYQNQCYEQILSPPIKTSSGTIKYFNTHAWKKACNLQDFVVSVAPKETAFDQWRTMLAGNNLTKTVDYLKVSREKQFPELVPDRHWHAFRNGLYCTNDGSFHPYGSRGIPPEVVACKYHDLEFDTDTIEIANDNWYDIPTPNVQKILEYQLEHLGHDQMTEVIMWIYSFLGRLLFEVGEKDGWQVILFCMGRAGTGKSRLIDAATNFFNEEDIAVLANNSQRDFGLETFVNKLVWACYEVKHDLTLDQANFQSMVTGEKVSIARKNKEALTVVWKIPGMLAGNEPGGWTDNSGSISRRIVLLKFDKKVQSDKLDPLLDKKIKQETANLLHKCCHAYLTATRAYGNCDIWKEIRTPSGERETILPRYFHTQKERLVELTHPLATFLRNSDRVVLVSKTTGLGMPFKKLQELGNEYFKDNNFTKFSWKLDKYKAVMEDFGIEIRKLDSAFISARGGPITYGSIDYNAGTDWAFGVIEREFVPFDDTSSQEKNAK